jgi:hypothetical protein
MYLSARRYISKYDDENESNNLDNLYPGRHVNRVTFEVGYWRKANAIHNFFVENCQGGKDECQETYIDPDDLKSLLLTVNDVLADRSKAMELLPPVSGFFFGSTEIDDWYFEYLERTKNIIEDALSGKYEDCDFYYQSSW